MTPERKAYLAKCGKLEKKYRKWIQDTKERIKEAKERLSIECDVEWEQSIIRSHKVYLGWYKHELNRLKGMDRVVVPRNYREWNASITGHLATCECGRDVSSETNCPVCGRPILCEKLK